MSQQLVPGFELSQHQNQWIWSNPAVGQRLQLADFDLAAWQASGGAEPVAGRGSACRIPRESQDWFLRHYRRGGLIGKLLHDQYLWLGAAKSRVVQEINVTHALYNDGLPVPKVVGGRLLKQGLIYRADLITEALPASQSMAECLPSLSPAQWQAIAETVAALHGKGLWHADLNAHNILLADTQVWVIDFDRARFLSPARKWQQNNLERLWRSVAKVAGDDQRYRGQWQQFLTSYNAKF